MSKLIYNSLKNHNEIKKLNVLVVSGGSFQGLTLIKGLQNSDLIRIIMVDSSSENICRYFVDKFYVVPKASKKEQFLNSLLTICKKENVNVIFPSTDIELIPLAESLDIFKNNNIYVAVSNPGFLKIAQNKLFLYKFLKNEGFPTLPNLDLTNNSLKFPVFGKPLRGWGSRGTIILNSRDEMHKYKLSELKNNFIWQPYLKDFDEYSIDCALNFNGTISEFIIRLRVKTIGGFAVISENVHDPKLKEMINKFLILIISKGALGIFNIQVLKYGSKYFFSDVNPRIGTSAVFSYPLGINFPLFMCSYINPEIYNIHPLFSQKSKKLKMVRYLEELCIEKENFNKVKAFVFDLDDTLINQKSWMIDKLEILWTKFYKILPEKRAFLLKATQIIEEGNRSKLFDALAQEFKFSDHFKKNLIKIYRETEPQKCPLFPDVLPTLKGLKEKGFKLALLTDNPPESQKQKTKICNFNKIFDLIIYSREIGQEKPSNIAFNKVAKLLETPAQSLVMVGDNLYKDVLGSLEANYKLAYWIVREGTFYNFNQKLFDNLLEHKYNYRKINDLRSLLWSFQ